MALAAFLFGLAIGFLLGSSCDQDGDDEEEGGQFMKEPSTAGEGPGERDTCAFCGEVVENRYRLVCPKCGRDGCPACIPAGRGCACPECEEKED